MLKQPKACARSEKTGNCIDGFGPSLARSICIRHLECIYTIYTVVSLSIWKMNHCMEAPCNDSFSIYGTKIGAFMQECIVHYTLEQKKRFD